MNPPVSLGQPDVGRAFLELGAVVVLLAILARSSHRVGLSPIPAYLVAGVLFRASRGGVALASDPAVELGARIGVVLLLFMLGLEYTGEELWHSLRRRWPAGLFDLVANFLPGALIGLGMGWSPQSAVVLGGVTYISSSGLIAKMLGDLGRMGNRETPVILSILVLEDLAMAVYLPLVVLMLLGGDLGDAAVSIAVALGATFVALAVAVRLGPFLSRLLCTRTDEALLLSVLGLALLAAGVAERLELSAAIGAFLVGIALSGPVQERASTLVGPLRDLSAAAFFFLFGMAVDLRAVPEVLALAIFLALVSSGTKMVTGWWAAKREGIGSRACLRAGTALVARGEFSIVIAGLALGGPLEPRLAALAGVYVFLLAVLGPLVTRIADPLADGWLRGRRRWRAMPAGANRGGTN